MKVDYLPIQPSCPTGALIHRPGRRGSKDIQRQRERGWNKDLLNIAFGTCEDVEVHSELTALEAQLAVVRAIETWNAVGLSIRLATTSAAEEADVLVEWRFSSDDPEGTLNAHTQAHADFPPGNSLFGPPPLPMHFNADFLWGIEEAGCFDVETIALHELGHCLGLIYHSGFDTIMYADMREAPFFVRHQLDPETLARIRQLY